MSNALDFWKGTRLTDFSSFQDSFDRLFNEMLTLRRGGTKDERPFFPSCEVTETPQSYCLKFDLPGVKKDQVKIEIDGDRFTVSAERREERKEENKKRHVSEISYGSYTRTFTIPGPIEEAKVEAKFDNGVLSVTIPKNEEPKKTKQIQIS